MPTTEQPFKAADAKAILDGWIDVNSPSSGQFIDNQQIDCDADTDNLTPDRVVFGRDNDHFGMVIKCPAGDIKLKIPIDMITDAVNTALAAKG